MLKFYLQLFSFLKKVDMWHKNLLGGAQKTILCQKKISHRTYAAYENYVSHKKIFCGNKKNQVTAQLTKYV